MPTHSMPSVSRNNRSRFVRQRASSSTIATLIIIKSIRREICQRQDKLQPGSLPALALNLERTAKSFDPLAQIVQTILAFGNRYAGKPLAVVRDDQSQVPVLTSQFQILFGG